jgi:adenosylhomocysteine nucleosidase
MFCANPDIAISLKNEFNIECVEMEGAAIAQVCNLDLVPCLVIRGISDVPNGNNEVDFHQYLEKASKRVAKILCKKRLTTLIFCCKIPNHKRQRRL